MATIFKLKRSGTAGVVPTSLNYGELAINTVDGYLFYGNASNSALNLKMAFANIVGKPTTLSGYGITDALSATLGSGTSIADGPIYSVAQLIKSGKPLYGDPDFSTGTNSLQVYNNNTNGAVTITRSADTTAPNSSKQSLTITKNASAALPGLGGIWHTFTPSANQVYAQLIVAKIPVGYNVNWTGNITGTNSSQLVLGATAGTGKWETYVRVLYAGDTGSFLNAGHMYLSGPESSFTWYIAQANVYRLDLEAGSNIEDYQVKSVGFNKLTSIPTTLSAHGITDTYTKSQVQSRGMNLLTNGFGTTGDNLNFSSFTFNPTELYSGGGSFTSSVLNGVHTQDELVPVDPNRYYRFSLAAKSLTLVAGNNYAYGTSTSYDVDLNVILPVHYTFDNDTYTTLAAPLKPGDTTISLTSAVAWDTQATAGNNYIKIHSYKNTKGYYWPVKTYSRNVGTLSQYTAANVNLSTNVITLSSAWTIANPDDAVNGWPAGTPIGTCFSGGSYQYFTNLANTQVPVTWTNYTGVIGGAFTNSGQVLATNFPTGTAYIKVGFLVNRNSTGVGGTAGNVTAFSAMHFSENTIHNYTNGLVPSASNSINLNGAAFTFTNGILTSYTGAIANATTTVSGFMSAADKTKLDGVATNANNYVHPSGDGNSHVPATGTTNNLKVLKAGSTANSGAWGNVAFGEITGALAISQISATGTPSSSTVLFGDGTWKAISAGGGDMLKSTYDTNNSGIVDNAEALGGVAAVNYAQKATTLAGYGITDAAPSSHVGAGGTAHAGVTTTTDGFMLSTDKTKLDSIQSNANNYVHPSGDGNSHVPATGTTNNLKVLKAGSTANSSAWGVVDFSELSGGVTIAQLAVLGTPTETSALFGDGSWKNVPNGDMTKSVYDSTNNGVVDNSEALGGIAASSYARTDITNVFSTSQRITYNPTLDTNLSLLSRAAPTTGQSVNGFDFKDSTATNFLGGYYQQYLGGNRYLARLYSKGDITLHTNDDGASTNGVIKLVTCDGTSANFTWAFNTTSITAPDNSTVLTTNSNLAYNKINATGTPSASTWLRGDGTWSALPAGGNGTVTSVGVSVPTGLTVSGSPVTTSGNIALAWSGQIPPANLGTGTPSNSTYLKNGAWVDESRKRRFYVWNDFVNQTSTNQWAVTSSGTGVSTAPITTVPAGRLGVIRFSTGTTATGSLFIGAIGPCFFLGQGTATITATLAMPLLSTSTQTYTNRMGFMDNMTADSVDGVYFRYTDAVNSGRFQAVSRLNSTETAVDTGVTVVAATYYNLGIYVNADASSVNFTINGATVATITTNIPKTSGRDVGYGVSCVKSVGTTAVTALDIDYMDVEYILTTART